QEHPVWTLGLLYGVPLFYLAVLVVGYFQVRWFVETGTPAEVDDALQSLLGWILIYLRVAAVLYLASVACRLHSWWTVSDPTERNQAKCILLGSVVALVPIGYSLYLAAFALDDFGSGAATWPMFAASACFTTAFAVSITRYRLMQLDQILTSGAV